MVLVERHPGLLSFDGLVVRCDGLPEWHPRHVERTMYCDEHNLILDWMNDVLRAEPDERDWLLYESRGYRKTPRADVYENA